MHLLDEMVQGLIGVKAPDAIGQQCRRRLLINKGLAQMGYIGVGGMQHVECLSVAQVVDRNIKAPYKGGVVPLCELVCFMYPGTMPVGGNQRGVGIRVCGVL